MGYIGSWAIDDYLTFNCNTHSPDTGAAKDADSVPTYRIYEDETGAAIVTGSMALLDDANTTGFYSERVQLTAANGFEIGKSYRVYISATVDSITATISRTFQIGASVDVDYWKGVAAQDMSTDAEIVAAVKAMQVESAGTYTLGQVMSIVLATLAGVTADGGLTFKTPNGASTRVACTSIVAGERTAMTLTPSA